MEAGDFKRFEIEEWNGFEKHTSGKWIYRGQRNASWTFESSLQRLCKSMDIEPQKAHIIEKTLASEFKRRFHQYSNYIPDQKDNLEWLSLMRHYMAPTRLLDWNYSIYIATYFALELDSDPGEEGSAVWALNQEWATEQSRNSFLMHNRDKEDVKCIIDRPSYGGNPSSFTKLFLIEPFINTVCPISPIRLTQRITVQKGLFLCPGNPNVKFDNNIESMNAFNDERNIKRLVIRRDKRREYLKKLYGLNITHATLFPGLDGFAHSLPVYHHSFEKDNLEKSLFKKDDSVWDI